MERPGCGDSDRRFHRSRSRHDVPCGTWITVTTLRARYGALPTLAIGLVVALCTCAADSSERSLTIVHTNDLHARLLPDAKGRGGFAEVAATIRKACVGATACLVMDGGDMVQGSPVSSIFEGVPVFEIANRLGIDVSTLGNHEFDYGWQKIPQFMDAADFPILNANLTHPDGGRLGDAPSTVLTTPNGIRVGVVGALTASLPYLVAPDLYAEWTAQPVVESVEGIVAKLNEEVDVVIVLGHLDDDEENDLLDVPGVDFVISGHSHAGLSEPVQDDDSAVIRAKAFGHQVGRLELTVNVQSNAVTTWSWETLEVRDVVKPDEEVLEVVQAWEKKVSKLVDIDLATSGHDYTRDEMKTLFEQALAEETGADVAYLNRGAVRAVFYEGPLLVRHVWEAMPFEDYIVVGTVRGSDLPAFLRKERGLDPDREYRFATIDFVVAQWETRRIGDVDVEHGELFRDLLIRWIGEQGRLD
jgi:2',3'-cyclic-nucleotide 2'-phosphodiesterase (5'-nucleotidase family)